ncbi:hypothetical protein JXA47_11575 [Candidatus Sumerlaeota bacterium]|nr:hypothetical protein [Candidatus Sumerlaeota bacterium]
MSEHDPILFREVQRFAQWWLWAMLIGLGFIVPLTILVAIKLAEEEVSSTEFLPALLATGGCLLLIGLLFAVLRMTTEVRRTGLYLGFLPFRRLKQIPLEGMTEHRAVEYRPVRDYGGWGIKGTRSKRAFNVKGNRGVRIDFEDGRHILIGSQEPERLDRAIEKMLRGRR